MHYTYSQNTTTLPVSNIPLHGVQLHISALCIGHLQVVLRLAEQLYNKRGILWGVGVGEVVGRYFVFITVGDITLGFIKLPLNNLLH